MQHNKKNIMWPEEIKSGNVTWQSNEFGDCYQSDEFVYGFYFEKHNPKFRQVKDENGKTLHSVKVKEGHWKVCISHKIPKKFRSHYWNRYKFVQGQRTMIVKMSYENRLTALNLHINGEYAKLRKFISDTMYIDIPKEISPTTLRFLIDDLS